MFPGMLAVAKEIGCFAVLLAAAKGRGWLKKKWLMAAV